MDRFVCNSNTLVLLGINFESLVISKAEKGFQEDGFEYCESVIEKLSTNLTCCSISWEKVGFDRLKIESIFRENRNKFRFVYLVLLDCGVSQSEADKGFSFLGYDKITEVFDDVLSENYKKFQKFRGRVDESTILGESLLMDCPYIVAKNGFLTNMNESFMMANKEYRHEVAEFLYDSCVTIEFNNRR